MLSEILDFIINLLNIVYKKIFLTERKDISNDIVLITGAANGIGRQLAIKIAKKQCKVIICDLDENGLNEVKTIIENNGGQCWKYTCDLTNKDNIYQLQKRVSNEIGKVSILVNNAGYADKKRFIDKSDDDILRTFQVNTLAHLWMCKAFLPDMIAMNSGHLVFTVSAAGYFGTMGLSDYSSSKFANVGFIESLRSELDSMKVNIQITEISPYFIKTQMFDKVDKNLSYFTVLTPDIVAQQMLHAILENKDRIIIPKIVSIMQRLKSLMTPNMTVFLNRILIENLMRDLILKEAIKG